MKESGQIEERDMGHQGEEGLPVSMVSRPTPGVAVALLTGGGDKPYAFGLATELISKGAGPDIIGSDELDCPEFHGKYGSISGTFAAISDLSRLAKECSGSTYYAKLIRCAATANL
jgi:hypothetical protein